VAGRVVDADAHTDELVIEPVNRGVEAADQLAGRARLLGAAHHVERHAVDVGQQPPESAARRDEVGPAVTRRQQARRHQARRRETLRHGGDVAVHVGREDGAHRLQHRPAAVRAGQQVAAVDQAAADARDRRARPPAELGQDLGADLVGLVAHFFFADKVTFTGATRSRAFSETTPLQVPASGPAPGRLLHSDPM